MAPWVYGCKVVAVRWKYPDRRPYWYDNIISRCNIVFWEMGNGDGREIKENDNDDDDKMWLQFNVFVFCLCRLSLSSVFVFCLCRLSSSPVFVSCLSLLSLSSSVIILVVPLSCLCQSFIMSHQKRSWTDGHVASIFPLTDFFFSADLFSSLPIFYFLLCKSILFSGPAPSVYRRLNG